MLKSPTINSTQPKKLIDGSPSPAWETKLLPRFPSRKYRLGHFHRKHLPVPKPPPPSLFLFISAFQHFSISAFQPFSLSAFQPFSLSVFQYFSISVFQLFPSLADFRKIQEIRRKLVENV